MSDFHSLAERLGFSFCRYLFKRKHVCCLISAWHLTIFSDQSDTFFYFLCWPSGGAATRKKHTALSFSSRLSKAGFCYSYQHQIPRVLCSFFSFICVYLSLFFFFFWSNTVCWDLIATIRAEVKKNHFPVSKVSTTLTLLQNYHNLNLLLFTSLQFSEPAQLAALKHSVLFSVGHCRYIFLSECVLL